MANRPIRSLTCSSSFSSTSTPILFAVAPARMNMGLNLLRFTQMRLAAGGTPAFHTTFFPSTKDFFLRLHRLYYVTLLLLTQLSSLHRRLDNLSARACPALGLLPQPALPAAKCLRTVSRNTTTTSASFRKDASGASHAICVVCLGTHRHEMYRCDTKFFHDSKEKNFLSPKRSTRARYSLRYPQSALPGSSEVATPSTTESQCIYALFAERTITERSAALERRRSSPRNSS